MRDMRVGWLLVVVLAATGCRGPADDLEVAESRGSASSPIALSPDGRDLWVVNPDADTVTRIDTRTLEMRASVSVGREPWGVAVSPAAVVVTNRHGGSVTLLGASGPIEIPVGPELGGAVLSADGRKAYVTVSARDEVAVLDLASRRVAQRIPVGARPWMIGVADANGRGESPTVVVTHRLARLREGGLEGTRDGKEAWLTLIRDGRVDGEIVLGATDAGFPNALEGLAVDGDTAWVAHLLNDPDGGFSFHTALSGGLSTVSTSDATERTGSRIETNDSSFSTPVNFPRAVAVSPDRQRAYLSLSGTNAVMGVDLTEPTEPKLIGFWPVGSNPRGIVLNASATRAYVMNYLSRDVSVLDLTDTVRRPEIARIPTADATVDPAILAGKILFHHAADPRLSRLGWISCASCHLDGGVDGTTWMTPDGPRQTRPLWSLDGTAPFHASATRDEVQDFDHDIRSLMGGIGLAPAPTPPLLGAPAAGRSADLDALASFVLRGIRVPRAPRHDSPNDAGRRLFRDLGCAECHGGPAWTASRLPGPPGTLAPRDESSVTAVLREVGTYRADVDVVGAEGFDPPTLLGLVGTAPYLHDGSASTLGDVLRNEAHTGTDLDPVQMELLVGFLRSIDGDTPIMESPP